MSAELPLAGSIAKRCLASSNIGELIVPTIMAHRTPSFASRARLDFERVDAQPRPTITDTNSCAQSNAAALPIARPEERYIFFYRKGYCELFSAVLTGSSESFQAASRDFTETIANWPRRTGTRPPTGVYAMVSIARVEQGRMADSYPDILKDLAAVIVNPECPPTPVMSASFCLAASTCLLPGP